MIIKEHEVPENGQIRFEYSGKMVFCYLEFEQDGMTRSVCAFSSDQGSALDKALEKKQRMSRNTQ